MSRTVAHTPWHIAQYTGTARTYECHDHSKGECLMTTLDDYRRRFGPSDPLYQRTLTKWLWEIPCDLEADRREHDRFLSYGAPPRAIRDIFTKPARQHVRMRLHEAKREYNTYGETDLEPEPYRPRHQAQHMWDMY